MNKFSSFLVERIYKIEPDEERQIKKIIDLYKEKFRKDSKLAMKIAVAGAKAYFQKELEPDDTLYLGTIKYLDLQDNKRKKTKVFLSFEENSINAANYDDRKNIITVYYDSIRTNSSRLNDLLEHELLHAKQHYKVMSKDYIQAIKKRKTKTGATFRSERDYYTNFLEKPVFITRLIRDMMEEFNLRDRKEKIIFLNTIHNFIMTGANMKYAGNDLPDFLNDKREFFKTLFRNRNNKKYRKHYLDLLKKLYHYYNKMKMEFSKNKT